MSIFVGNKILNALHPDYQAELAKELEPITLELRQTLETRNQPVEYVYFIENGLGSIVAQANERQIEIGIVGREGMTGLAVVLGNSQSPFETFMQIAGSGKRISAEVLRKIMVRHPALREAFLLYSRSFLIQTAYTALANGGANIEERLARWLLMAQDRLDSNKIGLTHEFLSVMLGVRRPGVTVAIHILEGKQLIRATRGQIEILDRDGLKEIARESYGPTEAEYDRLFTEMAGQHSSMMKTKAALGA